MTRQCTCAPHYTHYTQNGHEHPDNITRCQYVHLDGTDVKLDAHWRRGLTCNDGRADAYTVRVHGGGHVDRRITCFQPENAAAMFNKIVAALKESRPLPWWIGDHQ